jgi:hypothetical protein
METEARSLSQSALMGRRGIFLDSFIVPFWSLVLATSLRNLLAAMRTVS